MAGQIDKLKPLKVYGRTHYACTRCKLSKVKCSGEKPACSNCKALNKGDACVYPSKDRKIVIMESDLKKLHQKIEYLERRELEQTDGSGVKSNEKSSERSELVERSGDTNGQTDYEYPSKTRYSVQNQLGEFGEIETLGSLDGPTNIPSSLPGGTPNFGVAMGQLGLGQFSGNPQGRNHNGNGFHGRREGNFGEDPQGHGSNLLHGGGNNFPGVPRGLSGLSQHTLPTPHPPTVDVTSVAAITSSLFRGQPSEDFFLPEYQNETLQLNLLHVIQRKLPPRDYTNNLISKVYATYCSEFYLLDLQQLTIHIDQIYHYFTTPQIDQTVYRYVNQTAVSYLFVIIAFGEQLLNVNNEKSEDKRFPGIEYYLLAEHLFRLTKENIDFMYIQTALFLGLYAANLSRYNTVYNFLGIAMRSSVSKNLHRQIETPTFASDAEYQDFNRYVEKAKRLWWTVFVIDTTWATKTVHFQYTDTDVDLPCENIHDIGDHFQSNILELNVHMTKYIAKIIRLIYGPNIRTFSINYINTSQFNQRLLLNNIILSSNELVKNYELPLLLQFSHMNVIQVEGRNLANLFLRYNRLIILITKPLLSLIFETSSSLISENLQDVESTISKGLYVSCNSIDIIAQLYLTEKNFQLGYWDSQHLFSALLLIIISGLCGKIYTQLSRGIALLKFMAEMNNINAKLCLQKLYEINETLKRAKEVDFLLDLSVTVDILDEGLQDVFVEYPLPLERFREDFEMFRFSAMIFDGEEGELQSVIVGIINDIQGWK